jgi:hypothetical protein
MAHSSNATLEQWYAIIRQIFQFRHRAKKDN